MARLNNEDWLDAAKKVPVGQQRRMRHGRESRENMVVGNANDRWWAYCQACKCGGVESKTHVLLVDTEPEESRSLMLPSDMRGLGTLQPHEYNALAGFLASKNMDWLYLPEGTAWSASRQRLMIPSGQQLVMRPWMRVARWEQTWMGRDTSGKSPQKWLTYNGQHYVGEVGGAPLAVLVEDMFSYLKVKHALKSTPLNAVTVYCTLGTAINDTLFIQLLQNHTHVASLYDGDTAGYEGASRNQLRLMGAGIGLRVASHLQCAPDGLDPKDMTLDAIRSHIQFLTDFI